MKRQMFRESSNHYCMEILYSDGFETPLGPLHIIASEHGISHIQFSSEYQPTALVATNAFIEQCIHELREYFAGKRIEFTIPFAPSGTPFEEKVWKMLTSIPYGSTCSYFDIAHRMNNPKAIRAVGRANGANPIAIVIPCHRVVGADGSLTGYSGELWRKRWLLDHEARVSGTILL
jgi:methylated-DNA-[protein]-cysteine S-methyltransferase